MSSRDATAGVGVLPLDWPGGFVVSGDVGHELASQIVAGPENAAVDEVALDLAEPELDLVEPGRLGGREVQMDVGVNRQEVLDPLGLMGGEVVQDDVDRLAGRLRGDHGAQEGNELRTGVTGGGLAQHLSGPGVERRVEGEGALADVLEAMAFGAAGRQRQDGVASIEGLDGGLFVEAEYDRVLGRVQVEGDHVGRLGLEIGVVRSHVALEAMRLQTRPGPNSSHPHVRDAEVSGQLAAAPVGASVGRRLAGGSQNLSLQPVSLRSRVSSPVSGIEAVQSLGQETRAPEPDETLTAVKLVFDLGVGTTIGQEEHEARSLGILCTHRTALGAGLELVPFDLGENDWRG